MHIAAGAAGAAVVRLLADRFLLTSQALSQYNLKELSMAAGRTRLSISEGRRYGVLAEELTSKEQQAKELWRRLDLTADTATRNRRWKEYEAALRAWEEQSQGQGQGGQGQGRGRGSAVAAAAPPQANGRGRGRGRGFGAAGAGAPGAAAQADGPPPPPQRPTIHLWPLLSTHLRNEHRAAWEQLQGHGGGTGGREGDLWRAWLQGVASREAVRPDAEGFKQAGKKGAQPGGVMSYPAAENRMLEAALALGLNGSAPAAPADGAEPADVWALRHPARVALAARWMAELRAL